MLDVKASSHDSGPICIQSCDAFTQPKKYTCHLRGQAYSFKHYLQTDRREVDSLSYANN